MVPYTSELPSAVHFSTCVYQQPWSSHAPTAASLIFCLNSLPNCKSTQKKEPSGSHSTRHDYRDTNAQRFPATRQHRRKDTHAPRGSQKRSKPLRQRASNSAAAARPALEAVPTPEQLKSSARLGAVRPSIIIAHPRKCVRRRHADGRRVGRTTRSCGESL